MHRLLEDTLDAVSWRAYVERNERSIHYSHNVIVTSIESW